MTAQFSLVVSDDSDISGVISLHILKPGDSYKSMGMILK
jgi:hypothetical protein